MSPAYLHRYVVDERSPRLEQTTCMRDECDAPAPWDCELQLVGRSGAISPGTKAALCGPHAVEWLRYSF